MNRKGIVAYILALICIGMASLSLVVWFRGQSELPSMDSLIQALGWNWLLPILLSIPGALIIRQQPNNRVGWFLLVPALVIATSPDSFGYFTEPRLEVTTVSWLLLWYDGWSWIPIIFPILLIPLHFPTGRPPSDRWGWVNGLAVVMTVYLMVLGAFAGTMGPTNQDWTVTNPIGFISDDFVDGPFLFFWGLGLITLVASSVISLVVRYRRISTVQRQQIRWLLYAAIFFFVFYTLELFFSETSDFPVLSAIAGVGFVLSVLALPAAIGLAILRYRLYDIDIIIRKTLQYAVLTALLALVYFGSIVLLQSGVDRLTGEQSPIVIVLSTLLIAAIFTPLRRRVQDLIDRRFYRKKYDAVQVLAQFAVTARDEVDMEALTRALLGVVDETMQPERLSLLMLAPKETG